MRITHAISSVAVVTATFVALSPPLAAQRPSPAPAEATTQVQSQADGQSKLVKLGPDQVHIRSYRPFDAGRATEGLVAGRAGGCTPSDDYVPQATFTVDDVGELHELDGPACRVTYVDVTDMANGGVLRVAVDAPMDQGTSVEVAVYGPDCDPTNPDCPEHLGVRKYAGRGDTGILPYTSEATVPGAVAGRWVVVAYSNFVGAPARGYEMRLAVQNTPVVHAPDQALLPDLRMEPGWDFHFTPRRKNHLVPGTNCQADEIAFDGVDLCLRYAFGWSNLGDGPFWIDLLEDPALRAGAPAETLKEPYGGNAYQSVLLGDGSTRRLPTPAGEWRYHSTHQHYHFTNFFTSQAFRATGRAMEPTAFTTSKIGGCAHDWKVADLRRMNNVPVSSQDSQLICSGAVASPTHNRIGLSTNWADVYWDDSSGNVISLKEGGAPTEVGQSVRYVIVHEADPLGLIAELDETNNIAYALVEVTKVAAGTAAPYDLKVALIERGYGRSPWDPKKVVLPSVPGCHSAKLCPKERPANGS